MQLISKVSDKNFISIEGSSIGYAASYLGTFSTIGACKKLREIILFINGRLVENDSIKKVIETVYQILL